MEPLWQYVASIDWQSWLDRLPDQVWSIWTVGGLLLLVGGLIAWRGLLQDRSRGRPRCPRCWYDMRSLPEPRCPECGFAAKTAAGLLRTRRYWRQAAVGGAVGLLGIGVFSAAIWRLGWPTILPTRLLIALAPRDHEVDSPVVNELSHRDAALKLSAAQWSSLLAPSEVLVHRDAWVRGMPLFLEFRGYPWMQGVEIFVRRFQSEAQDPNAPGEVLKGFWGCDDEGTIGPLGDDRSVEFIVRDEYPTDPNQPSSKKIHWRNRATLPIRLVDRVEDLIEPVRDANLDQQVRCGLRPTVREFVSRGCMLWEGVQVELEEDFCPVPDDVALGLTVEIVIRSPVEKRVALQWQKWRDTEQPASRAKCAITGELRWNEIATGSDWTLRLTGDAAMSLREHGKKRYWAGTVEYPSSELRMVAFDPSSEQPGPVLPRRTSIP